MLNTKEGSRVKIGKVDCTQQNELCSSHEVTGYPTLKFFKVDSEESVKFRGTRDLPTLTNFINEQLGEVPSEVRRQTLTLSAAYLSHSVLPLHPGLLRERRNW